MPVRAATTTTTTTTTSTSSILVFVDPSGAEVSSDDSSSSAGWTFLVAAVVIGTILVVCFPFCAVLIFRLPMFGKGLLAGSGGSERSFLRCEELMGDNESGLISVVVDIESPKKVVVDRSDDEIRQVGSRSCRDDGATAVFETSLRNAHEEEAKEEGGEGSESHEHPTETPPLASDHVSSSWEVLSQDGVGLDLDEHALNPIAPTTRATWALDLRQSNMEAPPHLEQADLEPADLEEELSMEQPLPSARTSGALLGRPPPPPQPPPGAPPLLRELTLSFLDLEEQGPAHDTFCLRQSGNMPVGLLGM
jgi:hypothetical protein